MPDDVIGAVAFIVSAFVLVGMLIGGVVLFIRQRRRIAGEFAAVAQHFAVGSTAVSCAGWVGDLFVTASQKAFVIREGHRQSHSVYDRRVVVGVHALLPLDIGFVWQSRRPYEVMAFDAVAGQPTSDMEVLAVAFRHHRGRVAVMPPLYTEIGSRNPMRSQPIVNDPGAQRAFEVLRQHAFRVEVTDAGATLEFRTGISAAHMIWAIEAGMHLVACVQKAAKDAPPSRLVQPLLPTWQRFAAAHGLRLRNTPLCLEGRLHNVPVVAHVIRRYGYMRIALRIRFDKSLAIGLNLRPMRSTDRMPLVGAKDIKTGDDLFDDIFLLQATQPEVAQYLFSHWVRRRVHALHERHPLTIDDRGIVTTVDDVWHPELALGVLNEAAQIASAIEKRQRAA